MVLSRLLSASHISPESSFKTPEKTPRGEAKSDCVCAEQQIGVLRAAFCIPFCIPF